VLIGAASLSSATQSIDLGQQADDVGQGPVLDLLVAGASLPPNPDALIEGAAMQAALEQARSSYGLIVIDTPPLAVSDAFPLLRNVDGVIIVGRVGRNRRELAERLQQTLAVAGAPLLGVVANGVKVRPGSYGYGRTPDKRQPVPAPVAEPGNGAPAYDREDPSRALFIPPLLTEGQEGDRSVARRKLRWR